MSNFYVGQRVRIVSDSFKNDPHNLPIGSVHVISAITPPIPFEEFPAEIKATMMFTGQEPFDLPERAHIKTGFDPFNDFANVVYEDLEPVEHARGRKIRMTDDDIADGYSRGDVFKVFEYDGELVFEDRDGDIRPLESHEYVFLDY